jgi:hypothetical protein
MPLFFGLRQGPNHTAILAPKFGYDWIILGYGDFEKDRIGVAGILYAPLIYLDRRIWHTRERAKSMKYPIRNYYDEKKFEYRDYNPK